AAGSGLKRRRRLRRRRSSRPRLPAAPPMSSEPSPPRVAPRRTLLRFLLLPVLVAGGYAAVRWTPLAAYASGPALAATIGRLRQSWWAPALLVGGYAVLSPLGVPATPLMIAGGVVVGAVGGS